ncbi:hypothetical protein SDC9_04296 [bioreactor metagenome]|uniref:L,D-TPase catalytic domain-containing protein n=1 Tax=bioreactor metagenome TaxID=1076179 RepID=A0A644SVW6_9ZZZZ|nr:L,D-transpeptidase family protein [Negativicutes bacterium]
MLKLTYCIVLFLCGLLWPFAACSAAGADVASIIINLPSRTLEYYQSGNFIKEYRVAIGSPYSPTPLGSFYIREKEVNPWWYPPGKKYSVPSGPANPLGYRWMGFLPTYGIHGTNMPWSIGHIISNGCVRMHEADVEELFELVDTLTPVKITYDRAKVRIDENGNASIGIYPDIYGYQNVSLASVKNVLAKSGLDGLADDTFLANVIAEEAEQQLIFAQVYRLTVNGIKLYEHAVALEGEFYVPASSIASAVKTTITWNEATKQLTRKQQAVPGEAKGNTIYVRLNDLFTLFGGKQTWQDFGRSLSLTIPMLFSNGQPISSDVHTRGEQHLVPALTVAEALGLKLSYDEQHGILRNSIRRIPVEIIDNQPYIDTAKLGEYYNATVIWNEDRQSLDLTDPPWPLDCSMYLDLMQDFQ